MSEWKIKPDETYIGAVTFTTSDYYTLKVSINWEGCSHIWITDDEGECYHHICQFDTFVKLLQELNELALHYFGDEGEYGIAPINEEERAQKILEFAAVEGSIEAPKLLGSD